MKKKGNKDKIQAFASQSVFVLFSLPNLTFLTTKATFFSITKM